MILVDSSFLVATVWDEDGHRDPAIALAANYAEDRLVTTNHVRGETWTVVQRRAGHETAARFLDELAGSRVQVVHLDEETELAALRWLRRHPEREYSFVDATCFAFMRAQRIRRALSFDEDFEAAGFELLRAE